MQKIGFVIKNLHDDDNMTTDIYWDCDGIECDQTFFTQSIELEEIEISLSVIVIKRIQLVIIFCIIQSFSHSFVAGIREVHF